MCHYLIRHALTLPTGPDSHRWTLAPEGKAQARTLARAPFWAAVAALYSSPEGKAVATVRPTAERHGLELRTDERLREARRPAVWLDDYDAAVRRYLTGAPDAPEGWEEAAAVRARMLGCLDELAARHGGAPVAVCGHGLALALYLGALTGATGDAYSLWRSLGFGRVGLVEHGRLVAPFGDPAQLGYRP